MDTLASNDEKVICGEAAEEKLVEEDEDLVANKRDFFQEADEVREKLKKATQPDVETKACRRLCERIGEIWSQYQEQPGLLDPFLEEMVEPLIGAIGRAVHQSPRAPVRVLPNLHILSSLLYLLTTVRGYKTVSRFFPHEAADLEACLEAAEAEAAAASTDTWSTLYCLTLWLGMVLLTPFDLQSIDSGGTKGLASRILELGQSGLQSTSRTRDASAWMLAKYFTRPDVTVAGSLNDFHVWTKRMWSGTTNGAEEAASGPDAKPQEFAATGVRAFACCGALQAWNQTLKAAPRSVLRSVWTHVLDLALQGPSGQGAADFKASSTLRKLRVKVACRAALVALPPRLAAWRYERGARSLLVNFAQATGVTAIVGNTENSNFEPPARAGGSSYTKVQQEEAVDEDDDDVPEQVEEVIELLLASLSDVDTVVRWSAAKGIGRITNRLSCDFGDQVLESLFERCFSARETDKAWHGGCLGLAELTRRGLLLPERLPTVVPLVCQALHFEQVSGNFAVGQHVRDAACYVCWAFARAYAPNVLEPYVGELATALIQVAVYDREINCRRAAAAAVQEHVGRQGTFPNGIDVVTLADYWTLSTRRNAYLVVAPQLAVYGSYRRSLIDHLVDRKLQHQDLQIRRLASQGLSRLAENPSDSICEYLNGTVLPKLHAIALSSGSTSGSSGLSSAGGGLAAGTVQARHGAVLGVAALVSVLQDRTTPENQNAVRNLVPALEKARAYRGRGGEVVRQASCALLARIAASTSWAFKDATCTRYLQTIDECARHATDSIQVAAADALYELARLRFKPELCDKCVDTYIAGLKKVDEPIMARRGYVLCLGALPPATHASLRANIMEVLCQEVRGDCLPGGKDMEDPQTRQYAVLSLGRVCLGSCGYLGTANFDATDVPPQTLAESEVELLVTTLQSAMGDYAVDRRGDVGSWVREVAMEVIAALLIAQKTCTTARPPLTSVDVTTQLIAVLLQQAVEKIDRLRERASGLLCYVICNSDAPSASAAELVELAYRRVCHGEHYNPARPSLRTAVSGNIPSCNGEAVSQGPAWPPAHAETLRRALSLVPASVVTRRSLAFAEQIQATTNAGEDVVAEEEGNVYNPAASDASRSSAIVFDALVPLLDQEEYRSAIASGLVISVGGITESTAKEGKRALLKYLNASSGADVEVGGSSSSSSSGRRTEAFTQELIRICDRVGSKDVDSEPKRVLAPMLSTVGMLLAEDLVPETLSGPLFDRVLNAVRSSKDIGRLRAAISAFLGLLRWPGSVRRKSMSMLLQFLGGNYPTVRQATAQGLYIRLLQEEGDLDLASDDVPPSDREPISTDVVVEVLELISVTPWATDDEEALAAALREVYAKLKFPLPTGGRSILVPKKAREAPKPKKATVEYADLVRENHY